jgi:hypothetical protein
MGQLHLNAGLGPDWSSLGPLGPKPCDPEAPTLGPWAQILDLWGRNLGPPGLPDLGRPPAPSEVLHYGSYSFMTVIGCAITCLIMVIRCLITVIRCFITVIKFPHYGN